MCTNSPHFIKLVSVGWIWSFPASVPSVETAEYRVRVQQITSEGKIGKRILPMVQRSCVAYKYNIEGWFLCYKKNPINN